MTQEEAKAQGFTILSEFRKEWPKKIEKYDKDLLDVCKKQLLGSINDNEYFGARFEISTTALLIRKGVQFKKRESPDFLVQAEKAVFLECTSCHISASPDTAGVKASML